MTRTPLLRRRAFLAIVSTWLVLGAALGAEEVRVMTSGAFTAAHQALSADFERRTGHRVVSIYGASMGTGETTIPRRLERGEQADVVILAASALEDLEKRGLVVAGSRVDLVRSSIAMAVRAGAPKPDISTVEALTQVLLNAHGIGYSSSASGTYLTTELFPRLGILDRLRPQLRVSEGAVGPFIARGDVEIGFQQVSELLPVSGIELVGPLPPGAQRVTVFSAGVPRSARPALAQQLLRFYTSPDAAPVIVRTGLEPVQAR